MATAAGLRTARQLVPAPLCGHSVVAEIGASVEQVWDTLHEITLRDMPATAALLAARALPSAPVRRRRRNSELMDTPLLTLMRDTRFTTIHEERPNLLTLGIIGQFWRLSGGADAPWQSREDFLTFDEPGYIKTAFDFVLTAKPHGTRLTTDTWNVATDPDSARKFLRYWRVVGWGSRLIRNDMVRAVRRKATGHFGGAPTATTIDIDAGDSDPRPDR